MSDWEYRTKGWRISKERGSWTVVEHQIGLNFDKLMWTTMWITHGRFPSGAEAIAAFAAGGR